MNPFACLIFERSFFSCLNRENHQYFENKIHCVGVVRCLCCIFELHNERSLIQFSEAVEFVSYIIKQIKKEGRNRNKRVSECCIDECQ